MSAITCHSGRPEIYKNGYVFILGGNSRLNFKILEQILNTIYYKFMFRLIFLFNTKKVIYSMMVRYFNLNLSILLLSLR